MKIVERDVFGALVRELRRPEISILLGPRQVGKTFLLGQLQAEAVRAGLKTRYYNLELPHDLILFNKSEAEIYRMLTEGADVVFIDEFHYLKNASKIFKAIFDGPRKVKIFGSGSSSLEIHTHLKESLAGRRLVTRIAPLNFREFCQKAREDRIPFLYEAYATHGGLPGLLHTAGPGEKVRQLTEMLATYIQKDVKSLIREENVRAFNTLIYLLAESQGSMISENSLAREVGLTAATINRHLSILEHTYVCHPVHSYARRLGNELKKSKKVYFYDLGIRNALLKDFGPRQARPDRGVINESFVFLQLASGLQPNMEIRFWRTKSGQEIDFVVLKDRRPFLIEVKTSLPGPEIPAAMNAFMSRYPETLGGLVFSENLRARTRSMGKTVRFEPLTAAPDALRDLLS